MPGTRHTQPETTGRLAPAGPPPQVPIPARLPTFASPWSGQQHAGFQCTTGRLTWLAHRVIRRWRTRPPPRQRQCLWTHSIPPVATVASGVRKSGALIRRCSALQGIIGTLAVQFVPKRLKHPTEEVSTQSNRCPTPVCRLARMKALIHPYQKVWILFQASTAPVRCVPQC